MPGQDWQIDFTHMPRHRTYRYLLVLVDTFSGWVEAFPTARETDGPSHSQIWVAKLSPV